MSKQEASQELVRINEVKGLTYRGVVTASAFLLDFDVLSLEEARQRILAIWRPGIRVYSVENALVVVLPQPLEISCQCCIGLALVSSRTGSGAPLIAMPLSEKQLERIKAPARSVIWFKHGELMVELLNREEDLSTWLNVGDMEAVHVISPAVPPAEAGPVLEEKSFDPRSKLASGSPKADGMDEFLQSLNNASSSKSASETRGKSGAVRQTGSTGGDINLEGWLNDVLGRLFKTSESKAPGTERAHGASEPSWLGGVFGSLFRKDNTENKSQEVTPPPSDWSENLKMDVYRMLKNTGLINFIFERQKEYMYKMLDLFEQGDWSEALKYGVPLGPETAGQSPEPFLDIPWARADLKINPNAKSSPPAALIYSHPDLYARMKKLYRSSVEKLTEAERYDEAAFVLAELLGENEEAVSYLESHGQLVLAAELAEARKLPPGLIVRQWFVAGDIERAVNIARLNNCFQTAVRLLEKDHKKEADSLREMWATHLALVGSYAAATVVARDVPELQDQALEWTRRALQLRDKNSGHLLAYWLSNFKSKDEWPSIKERVVKLLDDESRELAPARLSFHASLSPPFSKEIALLARKAGRALLRDHGRQYINLQKKSFMPSLEDQALKTDIYLCDITAVQFQNLQKQTVPIELTLSSDDIGADTIYDAALLPDGRTVMALGEAGVCVLNVDGKRMEHFSLPATQFVMSWNGDRLIALAKRGEMYRITRLDLVTSQFEDLGEARLTCFATTYDGSVWCAANESEFYVVDAALSYYKVLWQTNVRDQISSIVCNDISCSVSTSLPENDIGDGISMSFDLYQEAQQARRGKRIWQFVAGLLIPSKDIEGWVGSRNEEFQQALTTPIGREITVGPYFGHGDADALVVKCEKLEAILPHHWARIGNVSTATSDQWLALTFTQNFPEKPGELESFTVPVSSMCYLLDVETLQVHAKLLFDGARRLTPRIQYDVLTLCDDSGRVVALDLTSGAVLRNHCI
ncbi:MAG: bpX6 domain-containing protein [Candidatus Melainabacteria bacterium]|nr:bpX6 domain-containing protein [Candidatus Melainabacteria bacterium]